MDTVTPIPARNVCVIGAGVSGLVTAKYLHEAGIHVDCVDERDSVGGVWAYAETSGLTCAWRSLNQNSPRGTYAYSDYPMPAHFAAFPTGSEVCEYLNAYVDHFGFRNHLHLGARVARVQPHADDQWDVTLASGELRRYDAVVVASGHHNEPRYPRYHHQFSGDSLHSQAYRHRERFLGKRVLVIGFGASGSQIAVDVSHAAEQTIVSLRRGAWVLPHLVRGRPYTTFLPTPPWWIYDYLPHHLRSSMFSALYRLTLGSPSRFGLPKPDHRFGEALPTVCEGLHDRIANGRITIKPAVSGFDEQRAVFSDGTEEHIDAVIYCTGYHISFPFLPRDIFTVHDNRVRLYKRTFLPRHPGLAFVGAFQALTPAFTPVFEAQARLAVARLRGDYLPPSVAEMQQDIDRDIRSIDREFVRTLRNNSQVHGPQFIHECAVEIRHGSRRAATARKEVRRSRAALGARNR
jgi:dimethylaniline monooxygenase (N-oxide forming)